MTSRKYASLIAYMVLVVTAVALVWYANRAESAVPERYEVYVVQPGETLWGIAKKRYPGAHTGSKVHEIRELNSKDGELLDPGKIFPGQRIKVPVE